jgi:hypothetical protein
MCRRICGYSSSLIAKGTPELRKKAKGRKNMVETVLVSDMVDNPAEYAERVIHPRVPVIRTLRDDPVGQMHARGHLGRFGSDEAQGRLDRARLFQSTWEATGRGRISSIDFNGAGGSDPAKRSGINDRQRDAARRLASWQVKLGLSGFDLLETILIKKRNVTEAARIAHGQATKATITYTGRRMRECLDDLS